MTERLQEAFDRLKAWFADYESCAVAFSGGLDSTFLVAAATRLTDIRLVAVTVDTVYVPRWELQEARELAADLGVEHLVLELPVPAAVRSNPEQRCYLCKQALFRQMSSESRRLGLQVLVDGTNVDDLSDYRPGLRALDELGVESPLKACGFTKELIREGCRELGLPQTAEKPAYACLLTRLPHGTHIDPEVLRKIEQAELVLHGRGFPAVRVRVHGDIARIELAGKDFERILDSQLLGELEASIRELGFAHVTLDLGGYRQGSMNASANSEEITV